MATTHATHTKPMNAFTTYCAIWDMFAEGKYDDAADQFCSPDCTLTISGLVENAHPGEMIQIAAMWGRAFDNFGRERHAESIVIAESGATMGCIDIHTLHHSGPFEAPTGSIPATDRVFITRGAHFMMLDDDGLVKHWDIFLDTGTLMRDLT